VGITDILNTARDAMSAQTFGLTVTGQNVANVNTPGYVRREAVLETRDMGSRNFGTVQAAGIRRVADRFVEQQHLALTGLSSEASQRDQLLGQAEALFNDFDGTGLSSSMNALFSSFSALSSVPTDMTTRSTVLQRATDFAQKVRSTSEQLSSFKTELFSQARDVTKEINSKLDTIAELSGRINEAQATGQEPADLKDKRDGILKDLAELVDIRTYTDGNGQLVVQGPGATLIQANVARHLNVDIADGGALEVHAEKTSGTGGNVTAFVTGGKLAGILHVRDDDVAAMVTELDTFAFNVANEVNDAHSAGFGLDGQSGRKLFSVSGGVVGAASSLRLDAALDDHPELVAASSSAAQVPGDGSQAVRLAQIADAPLSGLGNLAPSEAYARLVGNVGQRKADAENDFSTREAMTAQIEVVRESVSGVSLDEEMISLTKFQRAFEAASRVFSTADKLLEDLLNIGR
jgi:flagellar hook-associated protein 1 FlgK